MGPTIQCCERMRSAFAPCGGRSYNAADILDQPLRNPTPVQSAITELFAWARDAEQRQAAIGWRWPSNCPLASKPFSIGTGWPRGGDDLRRSRPAALVWIQWTGRSKYGASYNYVLQASNRSYFPSHGAPRGSRGIQVPPRLGDGAVCSVPEYRCPYWGRLSAVHQTKADPQTKPSDGSRMQVPCSEARQHRERSPG